jgi:sec-independent protein translocase protein TatC
MNDIDDTQAPLLDHLVELRRRLLYCFGTLLLTFLLCLYFEKHILAFLVEPLSRAGQKRIVNIGMFEGFFVQLKVAFFSGVMLAFPVIANQLWQFVAPGLYRKEKKALLPFLLLTPVLFAAGAMMAYYVAVPAALHFLLGYQGDLGGIEQEALPSVGNYLDFIMQFVFGFGVAFLLPVLLMLLERAGIVTRKQLVSARRYAFVGCFAVALVLAPPDAGSMVMLALPLVALYEVALIVIWFTERKRSRDAAAEAAAAEGAAE